MAVISVKEKNTSKGVATYNAGNTTRSYSRYFLVECDTIKENPLVIITDSRLPQPGTIFTKNGTTDQAVIANGIEPTQQVDAPRFWDVEVKYAWVNTGGQPSSQPGQANNPVSWNPEVSFDFVDFQKPCYTTIPISGTTYPLTNSAGDVFDPPPMIDGGRLQMTVQRYEAVVYPEKLIDYYDAINSDTWQGCPPRSCKIKITAKRELYNNKFYWRHQYVVQFNAELWTLKPLDRGYNKIVNPDGSDAYGHPAANQKKQRITDFHGLPCREMQLLDGGGGALAVGTNGVFFPKQGQTIPPNSQNGYTQPCDGFQVYRELPFQPLNLNFNLNIQPK